MKKKNIFNIVILLVGIMSMIIFIEWNSELNKNNRYLTDKLLDGLSDKSGRAGELFDFDYDEVFEEEHEEEAVLYGSGESTLQAEKDAYQEGHL